MFEISRLDEKAQTVRRLRDGAFIPFDSANRDFRAFRKWNDQQPAPLNWTEAPRAPLSKETEDEEGH